MIQKYICRHGTGDPLNHSPAKFWLSNFHMVKHCSLSFVRVSMNFDYVLVYTLSFPTRQIYYLQLSCKAMK